jgi:hypothetical protein
MVMRRTAAAFVSTALGALGALAAAACDPGFEEETEVIDLRPLAITAQPPEQVLAIDPQNLPSPDVLLAQLQPIDLCALAGDPLERALRWSFTVCVEGDDVRCDEGRPKLELVPTAVTPDPDLTLPRPQMCARLQPSVGLLLVLQSAIDADPLAGFSGIDLLLQWKVNGDGAPDAAAAYAGKRLRFAAKVPETRVANTNPTVPSFTATVDTPEGSVELPLPLGRCVDQAAPITIPPGGRVRILPVEPAGLRETYVVPTFDGKVREFTETVTYQWLTTSGSFSRSSSGGKRDAFGNIPEIDSTYRTRDAKDPTTNPSAGPVDASIWIVQRDERLGEAWFESCVRVLP